MKSPLSPSDPGRVVAGDLAEPSVPALNASEGRFRALSEAAPIGVFEFDAAGSCIYHNPALAELSGRTLEQNLGFGWKDATHPDDRAEVRADWERAVHEGRIWRNEHRLQRPDGSVRWVRSLAAPNHDATGKLLGYVGTVEDITDRRVAEESLRQSEERYRKLLVLSPDAHFVHVDGKIVFVNPAFCRLLGAENSSQLIGKPVLEIIHPDYREFVRKRIQQAMSGQPTLPADQKYLRLDGGTVDVEAAAVGLEFKGHREVQVVARDISARKAVELALRESEERFKLVARAVSDVVWDWNLLTGMLWWSESLEATFGYRPAELGPDIASWKKHIHPADFERVNQGIHHAIDSGQLGWAAEYRFRCKNGSYVIVQDRGYILRDAAGRPVRMVGGMRDLTEQKKHEDQHLRSQRMESIGTLAGGIAHDLNNVLTPILMSVGLLKAAKTTNPHHLAIIQAIETSARRGADLVRQVLTFARGLDGQRVAINLRHVIADLERIVRETFPRNIQISSDAAHDLWPVRGDPTQIHQVLLNLAVNARDAMPETGSLTFTASNLAIDSQYAAASREAKVGAYVVLSVSDTGSGIPPEIRDRIFEPFFTTKEVGKGTGLGLATVHAIVKSHGGFVQVTSDLGHGTTFKVYLPADPSLNTVPTPPPDGALPRGRGELVLILDDEAPIRQITQQTLELFGYRVHAASDGAEGVAYYSKHAREVAVVLTDMMMPVMDGGATIQVLYRLNSAVKIIATSGLSAKENVARAASFGAKDFLSKPYTADTLLRIIREVIERPATPRVAPFRPH